MKEKYTEAQNVSMKNNAWHRERKREREKGARVYTHLLLHKYVTRNT